MSIHASILRKGDIMQHNPRYLPTAFNSALTVAEQMKTLGKWAIEQDGKDNEFEQQLEEKENVNFLTNHRKLSKEGNFTGSINGIPTTQVLIEVNDTQQQLQYLEGQFSDGVTGLVVNGGFFENGEVLKTYDGGKF